MLDFLEMAKHYEPTLPSAEQHNTNGNQIKFVQGRSTPLLRESACAISVTDVPRSERSCRRAKSPSNIAATRRVTTPSVGACGVLKTNPQERLPAKVTVRGSAHVEADETCSYLCKLFFSASPEQYVSIQATAAAPL
jgi:hypothetical protein